MCDVDARMRKWRRSISDELTMLVRTAIYIPSGDILVSGVITSAIMSSGMVSIIAAVMSDAARACSNVRWWYVGSNI